MRRQSALGGGVRSARWTGEYKGRKAEVERELCEESLARVRAREVAGMMMGPPSRLQISPARSAW
jgi:hypothetical protein